MRTTASLVRHVVSLDWRLVMSAVRSGASDLALPAGVGALFLSTLVESALEAAQTLSRAPGLTRLVVSTYAWTTTLAAVALTLAIGHATTARRVVRHLQLRPVRRFEAMLSLLALSMCGRQAVVAVVVGLPFFALVARLLPSPDAIHAALAMLATLFTVPILVRAFGSALESASYRTLLGIAAGALVLLPPSLAAVSAGALLALVPPSAVATVAAGGSSAASWMVIGAWALGLAAAEYALLFRDWSTTMRSRRAAGVSRIPASIRALAWFAGIPPALLSGELVRLVRWRRFIAPWCVAAMLAAIALTRADFGSGRTLLPLGMMLIPPFVVSSVLANLFAADRAGVQAYFLVARGMPVLRAKVLAIGMFALVADACVMAAMVWRGLDVPVTVGLSVLTGAAAFFLWSAGVGSVVSCLFPAATDPRSIGGGLLALPAAVVVVPANGLFVVALGAAAISHDAGRITDASLLAAGAGAFVVALIAAVLAGRVADRLLAMQREHVVATLGLGTTVS